jgi:hypothetical protein
VCEAHSVYSECMKLTAKQTGLLVQRALVLEPLADKAGCTSRYEDLPGRPLESFVLAGINVGPAFERFAEDQLSGETRKFHRFEQALQGSNHHTPGKYVNFGLLEILFPTVAARLACNDQAKVVPTIIELMKQAPANDVTEMVNARELAWSTSEKRDAKMADLTPKVRQATSPYDFYEKMIAKTPHGSAAEWVATYQQGLPLITEQWEVMKLHDGSLLEKISAAYTAVRERNPDIRVGILADMCAAAIFLYLSFEKE